MHRGGFLFLAVFGLAASSNGEQATTQRGDSGAVVGVIPNSGQAIQSHSSARKVREPATKKDAAIPVPQMEKLIHSLAGEWVTDEIYEASDLLPQGGTGHSRDSYRPGPARSSLIEEYRSKGDAGESSGIGIIWWDAEAERFSFVWCDSYALDRGCRVSPHSGKWEGDSYVQTDEHTVSGKRVFEKEVWSEFEPNSFTQTLYVGDASDNLKRFLTIKAKRISK